MLLDGWTLTEIGALVAAMAATGLAAGTLAGLLGVGGGIVIVPVLYYVFGALGLDEEVRTHLAVGTSLATIIPTSIASARGHHGRGALDAAILRAWGPPMVIGAAIGAAIAGLLDGEALTAIFATLGLVTALNMAFGRESWRLGHTLPEGPGGWAIAGGNGAISAMMGIGGGVFGVTAMTLFGVPILRAIGTASAFGLLIAVPGVIGFVITGWDADGLPPFSLGYVSLIGFALIIPTMMASTRLGVALAHRLDRLVLRRLFALFLGATCLRMAWSLLG